jgi:fluoride exporter
VDYLLVGLGGFLGTNARYFVANWIGGRYGTSFPYGTLLINVSGSFLIGLFLRLITERFLMHPHWRLFFAVGFLGGYTTFSTFSFESLALIQNGYWQLALLNMLGSVMLGLGATLCGVALARLF